MFESHHGVKMRGWLTCEALLTLVYMHIHSFNESPLIHTAAAAAVYLWQPSLCHVMSCDSRVKPSLLFDVDRLRKLLYVTENV